MDKNKRIKMIQRSKHKWDLLAPNDKVMVSDLTLNSIFEAIRYAEGYCSSFNCWSYVIVPKKDGEK